jgi:autotransporter-associated beta strand protein
MLSVAYVDDSATGLNNGTGWTDAYTSLQAALTAAVAPQEIRVAQGTYMPTAGSDRAASFALKSGVSVLGGYAGVGAPDPDARNIALYTTCLSGDIGAPGNAADNSFHVVVANGANATAVLDGVTISGGNANGTSSNGYGSGMYNSSSSTLINCTFTANTTAIWGRGGGIYNSSCDPTLINCTFKGNSAGDGGGMYNEGSSPELTNCTFTANSSGSDDISGFGGGMYNESSSAFLTNCTFVANSAYGSNGSGGGMLNRWCSPTLTNCILWRNMAAAASQISPSSPGTGGIFADLTYCDVQGGYGGTATNINSDPQFVRNPSPGPDGTWGTSDDDFGDLRLRLDSPCIDAGSNFEPEDFPLDIATDAAGNPRLVDIPAKADTGRGTAPLADIGAYEAMAAVQALAGGPYAVLQGSTVVLSGAGYSPTGLPISYTWDLDGDGHFDDASARSPEFSAAGMQAPQTLTIALRVTDSSGASQQGTAVLRVLQPIYVDHSATGLNNGTNWADAFTSLSSALAAAVAGQAIWVAQGTYTPTAGTDRTVSFRLGRNVSIYGGYAGGGAANPDARDVGRYRSILSGDIGAAGDTSDNSYHVVASDSVDGTAVLDGFTITGGNANGGFPYDGGGGMCNAYWSSPTLANCTFTGNSTGSSSFAGYGGGMYNKDYCSPTLTNCQFIANSAGSESFPGFGGGMYNSSHTSPVLTNCMFTANSAQDGGGMYNSSQSSPTLTNCTFSANSTRFTGDGGGMYNSSSSPTLINCAFTANSTGSHGFSGSGGGMFNVSSSPTVTNCVFAGNWTSSSNFNRSGGGMYNYYYSSPILTNCTFAANSAVGPTAKGGGMYNYETCSPQLTNCILWGNWAANGSQTYNDKSEPVVTYCSVQGGYGGTGNIDLDPQFVRNPDAGPDGTWGTADDDFGDLRLRTNSPCIDAGKNAAVPTSITADLAGNPRFADVPGVADSGSGTAPIVDMGPYESPNPNLVVAGTDGPDEFSLSLSPDQASIRIVAPGLSNTYSVLAINALTFSGGEGDDRLTVDFANGNPVPVGSVTFDGQGGSDCVRIVALDDNATLTGEQVNVGTAAPIGFSNTEGTSFDLGAGRLTKSGSGAAMLVAGSIYTGGTEVLGGTLVLGHANALPAGGSLTIGAGATVVLPSGRSQAVVGGPQGAVVQEGGQWQVDSRQSARLPASVATPAWKSSPNFSASFLPFAPALRMAVAPGRASDVPVRLADVQGCEEFALLVASQQAVKKKASVQQAVDQVLAGMWP